MTDIAINHDLLAKKRKIYNNINDIIYKFQKNMPELVKRRDEFKTKLKQVLSDTTKSNKCINKLKKKISKLDTHIKEEDNMLHKLCEASLDIYYEIEDIKSALNITSDDEDDNSTLFRHKVRAIEAVCNDIDIINSLRCILHSNIGKD